VRAPAALSCGHVLLLLLASVMSQDDAKPFRTAVNRVIGPGRTHKCLPQKIYDEFQIGLEKLKEELPEALEYTVVHKKAVTLRPIPSVYADEVGRLQPGDSVKGWPVGSWLFVKESKTPLPNEGAWTMIDGAGLGTGNLLMPEWSKLTLVESSAKQMKFSWTGIKVPGLVYYLQWMPLSGKEHRDGGASITEQPADLQKDASVCVTGLPVVAQVTFRAIAKLEGGLLVGASHVLTTAAEEETAAPLQPDLVVEEKKLEEETKKYKDLVAQMKKLRDDKLELPDFKDIIDKLYADRPRAPDQAKQFIMNMLYGEEGKGKEMGESVEAVQDMFGEATAGYEEGGAGVCNQMVADCIAAIVRKHG